MGDKDSEGSSNRKADLGVRLIDWIREAHQEGKRLEATIPKWIMPFGWVALATFVAFGLGLLGKQPYIVFIAFWILFAAVQTQARKLHPKAPNLAEFVGWFVLAVMAAAIGFMFYTIELAGH